MLNLLFGFLVIAGLLNGLLFGGSPLWSVLTVLVALILLLFRLFLTKRFNLVFRQGLSIAGIVLLLLVGLWSGLRMPASGYLAYDATLADADNLLAGESFIKAGELLADMEKIYGATDRIRLSKARTAIGLLDFRAAESELSLITNHRSDQYYIALGQVYMLQKKTDQVKALYIEAAKNYPLWSEVQRIAGTQSVASNDNTVAEYFLLRSNEQLPLDPIPLYYLGVVRYEQGQFADAEAFFAEALQLGLNNQLAGYVAWYREQIEGDRS